MPVDPNLIERTDAKLRYARLHLDELEEYEELGSLDDWERAHTESVLFHLVGAKDSFLQEVNFAYDLDLRFDRVNEKKLSDELGKQGKESKALQRIKKLSDDKESWYYLMLELRNHGTHRGHIRRLVKIGVGSAKSLPRTSHLKKPRTGEVIEWEVVHLLQKFHQQLGDLLIQLRRSFP